MCKWFEEGLNEDIKLLVGILELTEFVVLFDQTHKAEELSKEKRQAEIEAQYLSKRFTRKLYQLASKKSKKDHDRSVTLAGYSGRDRSIQHFNLKFRATSVASVGSVGNRKPRRKYCNTFHFGECCIKSGAYFRCGSYDHYFKDFPEMPKNHAIQTLKLSNSTTKGRPSRNPSIMSSSRDRAKDSTVKPEVRALARTYAIRAREDASEPNVITGTFSLLDTNITTFIDPSSTYSYICTNLVSVKNLLVKFTEFVITV
ncbi:uncharacterized protein LOC105781604 [Gossypium raimondii]|uniref:uncharacterized protein LOC105781604 n=1 Tax=Gossypium raimondii TaxID=29730 RepID=UPI00063AEA44|nr:uncharacterized protein LOC105781604 [Gossypium raimondii]